MLEQYSSLRPRPLSVWPSLCRAISISFLIFLLVGTTGCYKAKTYRGDGRIVVSRVGNWFINCTRYTVLFGPIDLTKKNVRIFKMQGLPHEEMTLTLEVSLANRNVKIKGNEPDALMRFELVDDSGRSMVQEKSHLNQMPWSYNGLEGYEHKASVDVGSDFKPNRRSKYTLTVEVLEPDTKARVHNTELVIWKFCG